MAGRVNTHFVLILSTSLVVLVGLVAAYWVVFVQRSVEQRIHLGDVAMAEGQYERAIDEYAKAIPQDRTNIELLEKHLEALRSVEVDDHLSAEDYLRWRQGTLQTLVELDPADEARVERRLAFEYDLIRDELSSWQMLEHLATGVLDANAQSVTARRYRASAQVRLLSGDLSRQDQLQPREDLRAVLEAAPGDPEAMHYLARWNLFEARRLDQPGRDPDQAAELRAEAMAMSRQMLEADPDDLHRQYRHLQILLASGLEDRDELEALVRELEAKLTEAPEPAYVVLALVDALQVVDQQPVGEGGLTWGLERGRDLLQAAIEVRPDVADFRAALGRIEAAAGRPDEAIEHYEATREMTRSALVRDYLATRRTRINATFHLANLLVRQAALAQGEDRAAVMDEIRSLTEEIAFQVSGEAAAVLLIEGKLALLEGELARAATLLDRASEGYRGANPEPLRFAAGVYERLGDWGAAADRLQAWIALQPQLLEPRLQLAELRGRGGELDQAEQVLAPVLAAQPDHPEANRLQAAILMQRGQMDEAMAVYERLDPETLGPRGLVQLVQLYAAQDRRDDAQAVVERRLEADPGDLVALQMLAGLDAEQMEARLADAEAVGADASAVDRLRQRLSGESPDLAQMLAELVDQEQDPMRRLLMRAQGNRRMGDREAMHEALAEAIAMDPNHRALVAMRFEVALEERDWNTAAQMAERAGEDDLDMARGAFYRGRLALAQGESRLAVAQLRQGLAARPIFSEGYRYLGDGLRAGGEFNDALEAYQQALDQRPDNAGAMRGLAAAHDARGEHAEALTWLRDAIRHGGMRDERLLTAYLDYEQTHGDRERALMLRQRLAETRPEHMLNQRGLAVLLAQMGRRDEARDAVAQLVEQHGQTRETMEAVAEVHRLAGQVQEGANVLRRYINSRGDDVEAADYVLLARYGMAVNTSLDQVIGAYERARPLEDPQRMQVTRELADLLFGRGEMERALTYYEQLYEQQGDDPNVGLRLAETLLRADRTDEAGAVLEGLPGSSQRSALLGIVARRRGDLDQAERLLDQALGQAPASAQLYYERARVRLEQGNETALAISDLNSALEHRPSLVQARHLLVRIHVGQGNFDEARRQLRLVLGQQPNSTFARRLLTELLIAAGDEAGALRVLEEGENRFEQDVTWPWLRAQLLTQRGEHGRAVAAWRVALSRGNSPAYLLGLLDAHLAAGQTDAALALLRDHEQAVRSVPALRAVQARARAAAGDRRGADEALAQAVQASNSVEHLATVSQQMVLAYGPDEAIQRLTAMPVAGPDAWRELTLAGIEAQAGRSIQAVSRLEAIDVGDDAALTALRDRALAQALLEEGDYERSRQVYEQLLEADPDHLVALNNVAYIMARHLNEAQAALPRIERAVELAPDNPHVLDTLGVVLHHSGELEEARRRLEQSLTMRPTARVYLHMAYVDRDMNEPSKAREMAEQARALALRRDDEQVLEEVEQLLDELSR
ncbi:MAG: tetratricopeptide repeat protein [Phycisphaeraceae bacterium]